MGKYFVFFVLLCRTVLVFANNRPVCVDTSYGRSCSDVIPDRVAIAEGNLLLIGTENVLFSFDTSNGIELLQTVDLSPDPETITRCIQEEDPTEILCKNSIRLVQPIPQAALQGKRSLQAKYNNTLLVCGTNAFEPKCTIHNLTNILEWFYLSDNTTIDLGFSPYSIKSSNIGLMASNGKFYTATDVAKQPSQRRISVAPNALLRNTTFIVGTFDRDTLWVSATDFISLYEVDKYMYFFATEPSYEHTGIELTYGRVMRVCKTDEGIEEHMFSPAEIPRFRTFQKIRIACPHNSDDSAPEYNYNELKATYLLQSDDESEMPILYATFSAPINGPEGSAVCKFSFDVDEENSLTQVFDTAREYYQRVDSSLMIQNTELFNCPGCDGAQRTNGDAINYQLINGIALPSGGSTLHTAEGESFTQIAVDIYQYDGFSYEVIYTSTKDGEVQAIIYKSSLFSSTLTIFKFNESITNMIIEKPLVINGVRRLYVSGENFIADIVLGNCSKYSSCVECLESNDPYCAWQSDSQLCINKLSSDSTLQTMEASQSSTNIDSFCGVSPSNSRSASNSRPASTISNQPSTPSSTVILITRTITITTQCHDQYQTSTISSHSQTSHSTTTSSSTGTTTSSSTGLPEHSVQPTVGAVEPQTNQKPAVGELIGALIGGLLVGIVIGTIVCFIGIAFKRKFVKQSDDFNTQTYTMNHENGRPELNGTVGQYKITVVLPEDEKRNEIHSPTSPSISPVVVDDSELEDDAISELPTSGPPSRSNSGQNRWPVPKGRTPSTRWLRASESETSTNGTESPLSPQYI